MPKRPVVPIKPQRTTTVPADDSAGVNEKVNVLAARVTPAEEEANDVAEWAYKPAASYDNNAKYRDADDEDTELSYLSRRSTVNVNKLPTVNVVAKTAPEWKGLHLFRMTSDSGNHWNEKGEPDMCVSEWYLLSQLQKLNQKVAITKTKPKRNE